MLALLTAGCATSSKVQEMIDASHRDNREESVAQQNSIVMLKQSSAVALEQGEANAEMLRTLSDKVEKLKAQQASIENYAAASKVMSAANTVKLADLQVELNVLEESTSASIAELEKINLLQEEVLVRHFNSLAGSASSAIASINTAGASATNNAPVKLDAPIEIFAPDTSADAPRVIQPHKD